MDKNNIFTQQVTVPEIVQQKADIAFNTIKKEGNKNMKRQHFIKAAIAVAACAAIIFTTVVSFPTKNQDTSPDNTSNNILTNINNSFTMKVHAKEMTEGNAVANVSNDNSQNWVLGGNENGNVSYCINMPLTCEGENIENITYSINKGAFQIVEPKTSSIASSAESYSGDTNFGQIGGGDIENTEINEIEQYKVDYYTSFTLAYKNQTAENTCINICGNAALTSEEQNLLFMASTHEDMGIGFDKMLDNVEITCLIRFTDGTTQEKKVKVGSTVATYGELNITTDAPDEKSVFVTFELQ